MNSKGYKKMLKTRVQNDVNKRDKLYEKIDHSRKLMSTYIKFPQKVKVNYKDKLAVKKAIDNLQSKIYEVEAKISSLKKKNPKKKYRKLQESLAALKTDLSILKLKTGTFGSFIRSLGEKTARLSRMAQVEKKQLMEIENVLNSTVTTASTGFVPNHVKAPRGMYPSDVTMLLALAAFLIGALDNILNNRD